MTTTTTKTTTLLNIADIEAEANRLMEPGIRSYLNEGVLNNETLEANIDAFKWLRIRPRYMVDVSQRNLSVKVVGGDTIPMPIAVSPFGLNKRFHPDGEFATGKGIRQKGTVMIVSSGSTISIEELATAEPDLIKWFQMFIYRDRNMTIDLAQRAKQAGFRALVLTVDHNKMGLRYHNEKNKYSDAYGRANYKPYNVPGLTKDVAKDTTWKDIQWIKNEIGLPIVIKGIVTAEDARLAVNNGADAILVSNHGGRQLDGSPATLEALPEIVEEVGREVDVYMDGGVRTGADVFKALAIGAKVVFVGRPVCWGLVCNGSDGVKQVLDILHNELDNYMTIAGTPTVGDITRNHVRYVNHYRNNLKILTK
ncbi:uncharacterized protein LOC128951423 [Oppia nitens]|uniref:uncharacterized protein LOC128951423 n=1 Tax=Oppia nitens TaxID=1686743 RepID=UPI0023DC83AC|nr:uncharacterized protein LOC128951423 [Oppia nitens]